MMSGLNPQPGSVKLMCEGYYKTKCGSNGI